MIDHPEVETKHSNAALKQQPFIRAGVLDMRLCPTCGQESEAKKGSKHAHMSAQDALENAVTRSNALNEALAILVLACEDSSEPLMTRSAVNGLQTIAMTEGAELRKAFDRMCILNREGGK